MAKKKATFSELVESAVSEQDLLDALDELTAEFEEMEMATAKTVNKLSDKLVKVNENFTINMYDNGFMVEAGGRNKKSDYVNAKIMCSTVDEVLALVREACEMERDS